MRFLARSPTTVILYWRNFSALVESRTACRRTHRALWPTEGWELSIPGPSQAWKSVIIVQSPDGTGRPLIQSIKLNTRARLTLGLRAHPFWPAKVRRTKIEQVAYGSRDRLGR
jgi:hypothetical protein